MDTKKLLVFLAIGLAVASFFVSTTVLLAVAIIVLGVAILV